MVIGNIIENIRKRRGSSVTSTKSNRRQSSCGSCMGIEHCGSFNIMLLGDSGVGKSLICSQYLDENILHVIDKEKDDIPMVSSVFLGDGKKDSIKKYDIHITTASGGCRSDTDSYKEKLSRSDGFVLVYSVDNTTSYMRMIEYLSDIQRMKRMRAPIIMMGNKADLKMPTFELQGQQENMIFKDITHFNASALNNEGIQPAFRYLTQLCHAQQELKPQ